jgi:ABC-type sugar transport system substrate-binding protein
MDIGAALAAEKMGKKVFAIGIDGNDVTLDLIKQGKVTATLGVYPRLMGVTVVKQMQKVLKGESTLYLGDTAHRSGYPERRRLQVREHVD